MPEALRNKAHAQQPYTFAIRTNQRSNQKLQKSYFLPTHGQKRKSQHTRI